MGDLYEGYAAPPSATAMSTATAIATGTIQQQQTQMGYPPPTAAFPARQGTAAQRMGTAVRRTATGQVVQDIDRPPTSVTSTRAAGYTSVQRQGPRPLDGGKPSGGMFQRSEPAPELVAREMEKKVSTLVEESALLNQKGQLAPALEKAKEAQKKEEALRKHREHNGVMDGMNIDLTYSVSFNLANQYQANELYTEALAAYGAIVKNKQYAQSGRLRVNMGNIYFKQGKYPTAIKMYHMAVDQIPKTSNELRLKIFRNIGHAFVRMGEYADAMRQYELVMQGCGKEPGSYADFEAGFSLVLCYFALGTSVGDSREKEKLKHAFLRLISLPLEQDEDGGDGEEGYGEDELQQYVREQRRNACHLILTAAKLVAPHIEANFELGFNFCIESLRENNFADLASEMEISKALYFLKMKRVDKAKETLMGFEKKDSSLQDPTVKSRATTNLCFLHFLEGDLKNADAFGTAAIKADRYNSRALVNKGNCELTKGDAYFNKGKEREAVDAYRKSQELYLEAIGVEADCTDALYNLGLVNRRLGKIEDAVHVFEKLHGIIPESNEVVFQMASLHEMMDNLLEAEKYYKLAISKTPSDARLLARYGSLLSRMDEESPALHNHLESYRYLPVDMDVIAWLGAYFVKNEVYEKAMQYFARAAEIQPHEVKWRLMVASCHRRCGEFQLALKLYEEIERKHPDNVECLNYLVRLCKQLGMKEKALEYGAKLGKAERTLEHSQEAARAAAAQNESFTGDGGDTSRGEFGSNQMSAAGIDNSAAAARRAAAEAGNVASKTKVVRGSRRVEDEDWGDGELDDLLPMGD